jgi:hypothetical protein
MSRIRIDYRWIVLGWLVLATVTAFAVIAHALQGIQLTLD